MGKTEVDRPKVWAQGSQLQLDDLRPVPQPEPLPPQEAPWEKGCWGTRESSLQRTSLGADCWPWSWHQRGSRGKRPCLG